VGAAAVPANRHTFVCQNFVPAAAGAAAADSVAAHADVARFGMCRLPGRGGDLSAAASPALVVENDAAGMWRWRHRRPGPLVTQQLDATVVMPLCMTGAV
jgi:hypothetical protein